MNKKFYSVCALALATIATANAQVEITQDVVADAPSDEGDLWAGESAITIAGCTVTIANDALNTCAFPFVNGETITLLEGGKVKFFDSPETAYPEVGETGWDDYMKDGAGNIVTAMPFNWIIEGKGNEIYLDSYCTFGGTIVGTGDLTIYIGDKNTFDFDSWNKNVTESPQFTGTIYVKVLDAYKSDSVTLLTGGTFPGHSTDNVSYTKTSGQWASVPFTLDVTGADNLYLHSTASSSAWPAIVGDCHLYTGSSYAFFRNAVPAEYDCYISGGTTGRDFEIYAGAQIAFNKPVESFTRYNYHRNGALLLVNSEQPSFSNSTNGFSGRNTNSAFGGNGWIDCAVAGKDGSTINILPGQGNNSIGTLKMKSLWLYNNNGVSIDFDGTQCDIIETTDSANFAGANTRFWINLMDDFLKNPKVGNYQVLNGLCNVQKTGVNDTIGYTVTDSVLTYVNINTGDTITYFTSICPGASGPREIDTLGYWGPGTGGYGTEITYTPSPDKIPSDVWAAEYSEKARAAIMALEMYNDSIKYTGHRLTATDQPIKYAYDYIYNFNLVVKNNELKLAQPTGDTLVIARDYFNFTFKTAHDTTYSALGEPIINYEYRYTTNPIRVAQVNGDSIDYWFDFTNYFTLGRVTLCNAEFPAANSDACVNVETSIGTMKQESHAILNRVIYTIDGKRVNNYVKGLNIVTSRYTDGTIETRKVFFAE